MMILRGAEPGGVDEAGQAAVPQLKRSRIVNSRRVLREIWVRKEISRVQIARNLDLDKSTVSSIVSELLAIGIVSQSAQGEAGPQGGRKPVFLRLNSSYGRVLGIELRPEVCNAVVIDLDGTVVGSRSLPIQVEAGNIRETFPPVLAALREEFGGAGTGAPLLGIGVGTPGVVNPQKGVIRYSIPLQIEQPFDFGREIAAGSDLPLFIDNDANACAWGELAFHRQKRLRDFVFLLVEFRNVSDRARFHERTGVGMGIVIGGRVHYGHSFSAGEFRSVLCVNGNKGQFSLSEEEAFRIEEDPRVLAAFIRELSRNIAMIVNTFNLSDLFLGGDVERYRAEVETILVEEIQRNWAYPDPVHCRVHFSSLGERAVAYGAAGMVLHHLFTDQDAREGLERALPSIRAIWGTRVEGGVGVR
jgi:predicted NBD/HSP70 family sugar kinase